VNLLAFLGALSAAVVAFEILTAVQTALSPFGRSRLIGAQVGEALPAKRRSTWEAILAAVFPQRFDPSRAKGYANVVDLLRRSGYPYDTPGEFYAAAIRIFTFYLVTGGLLAGAMASLNMAFFAPILAMIFVVLGLRKPYVRLKTLAKRRGEMVRNNMLVGLSMLNSLLSAGVGVQEAMRRTAEVGGPFCNLLGLLVTRMEVEDFSKALAVTRAHIPDPSDVEVNLFLRDIEDFYVRSRPLLASVQGLQSAVHRGVVEATEARASLVRRQAGLFGILAVVGLILSLIAPTFL
jgi:hypothetical protein